MKTLVGHRTDDSCSLEMRSMKEMSNNSLLRSTKFGFPDFFGNKLYLAARINLGEYFDI